MWTSMRETDAEPITVNSFSEAAFLGSVILQGVVRAARRNPATRCCPVSGKMDFYFPTFMTPLMASPLAFFP